MNRRVKKNAKIFRACLLGLLIVALVVAVVTVIRKNQDVKAAMAKAEQTESQVTQANEKIKDYEDQQQSADDELEELRKQLKEAQEAKKKLEKENASLKKQIETLRAKKTAEKKNLSNNKTASSKTKGKSNAEKVCYLTFDDGPSENTLKILKVLDQYDAKATFFVINSSHLDYITKIHDAGHAVALHSASHNYSKIYKSTDAFFSDLERISDKVEELLDFKPTMFRFPGGSSNTVSKKYCKGIMTKLTSMAADRGYSYFDWNVDSGDASGSNPRVTYIRGNVLRGAKNKNSICVLMHDTTAKTNTVKALPGIIEGLQKMGFTCKALTPEVTGFHHGINN
ncbi:MAG: polysaccharide deacetylase family protein [Clostridia bacterium]|nr:polysaccharide deacetylase family protein [Clostridia bacterium]